MLLERYVFFLETKTAAGDVMAESRGGNDDMRLKKSFNRLWNEGTSYIEAKRIQAACTSCQLKVKPKSANIAGLQLCDLIAHPSRNEILLESKHRDKPLPPFGGAIASILARKYYQKDGKVYGRKML
jgi:hypothetical protein